MEMTTSASRTAAAALTAATAPASASIFSADGTRSNTLSG